MPKKTILLTSGGVDSTFVLYKLLTETDDEVSVVMFERLAKHPELVRLMLLKKEQNAKFPKLMAEMLKIRPFTINRELVTPDMVTEETSHYYTYFVNWCAPGVNSGKYERLASGRTWEQFDTNHMKGKLGSPAHYAAQRLLTKLCGGKGELWNPLITHEFIKNYARSDALKVLPKEIMALTNSCADPVVIDDGASTKPCGECYRCLWDIKVNELLKAGWNSDQINLWRKLKGLQYGGGNNISAPYRFWIPLEVGYGRIIDGLDTQQKIMHRMQTRKSYILEARENTGIWDFSDSNE